MCHIEIDSTVKQWLCEETESCNVSHPRTSKISYILINSYYHMLHIIEPIQWQVSYFQTLLFTKVSTEMPCLMTLKSLLCHY